MRSVRSRATPPKDEDSVGLLLRRIELGDDAAVQQLFARCFDRVVAAVRQWYAGGTSAQFDEEDVAQAVFVRLWRAIVRGRLADVHVGEQYWRYVSRVLRRSILTRREHEHRRRRGGDVPHTSERTVLAAIASSTPPAEAGVEFTDEVDHLVRMLSDERTRRLAVLWLGGCRIAEIAAALNWSASSVRRKLHAIWDLWRGRTLGDLGAAPLSRQMDGGSTWAEGAHR
jgi:RNA polymerase sigma factor (sigma-70 family)